MPSTEDRVLNPLVLTLERRLRAVGAGTLTWCPEWGAAPTRFARPEGLWRAWDGCGYADGESPLALVLAARAAGHDPILAVLLDAKTGPRSDCNPTAHQGRTPRAPISTPAPTGYWGTDLAAAT